MRLEKRKWRVVVDNIETDILDVSFEIAKTLKHKPNTCAVTVTNLSDDHRRHLESLNTYKKKGPGRINVEIEAGYEEGSSVIFRGDLRTALSRPEGTSWTTRIEGEDGGRAVRWSRVNRSFPPGTSVLTVVRALVQAMAVGEGNAIEIVSGARFANAGNTFTNGCVISGPAPDQLKRILRSLGLTYSVQNGVIQVLRRGTALQNTAVRLAPESGLIDYPSRGADGKITAKCLIIPDVYPGRKIFFDVQGMSGFFRVTEAKYSGDTSGTEWYISLVCQEV